jgi:CrcB protein
MTYLYVAVGGVLGALSRFAIGEWAARVGGPAFPWATLLVNLLGSLLLGLLLRALPGWGAGPELRALLTVGFCGSFTTFSTFGYETAVLLQQGAVPLALAYALGSVLLGVAGVVLGLWLGAAIT